MNNNIIYVDASLPSDRIIFRDIDSHEDIRNKFVWERRQSESGKLLPEIERILLKDLSNKHLKTLCYFTLEGWHPFVNQCMIDEWNYRIENNIAVK